jgi:hypothetical protein
MSGVVADFSNIQELVAADAGLTLTAAVVVPDHLRDEVASEDEIRKLKSPVFGVVGDPHVSERFHNRLPNVELVRLASNEEFFEGRAPSVMGLITTAEAGSAWTLRYPSFQVVVPEGVTVKVPLIYPVGRGSLGLKDYVEGWARLMVDFGTTQTLYDHWILGRGAERRGPRWSIIRDVLHWVD